ncbi:uncharacterized protein LOC132913397 [Bombus pascuorum]|uniref:uncharacterized protein LOC132913397 n=1 Tax=Bombus pascuorum TaxID=65598 RepID=UPI00298DE831|nr:uncharacterized protein LOC132913397 [Bombus pascuorum]
MTWETSTLKEDYDSSVTSQLAEKKLDTFCGICGFYIDYTTLKKFSSTSFIEECHEMKANTFNYITKTNSNNTVSDNQEKFDLSTPINSMPDILPQLKRTCDQCQAIIQVCGDHKSYSICPGCLKVFKICTKCATIDQILQKLK